MWDQLQNWSNIRVGENIFNYLDLKSIVRFETALAGIQQIQCFRFFLSHYTKVDEEIVIPKEMSKLKWLQAHNFPISKAIVHLDKLNSTFETKMINKLKLVDNDCIITSTAINYLPDNCYEKIDSVYFNYYYQQDVNIMEELFSRLHNIIELSVLCRPDGWIKNALQRLYTETNNNILIETVIMGAYDILEGSIMEIAKKCPKMKLFSANFDITEDSLLALSIHCPLLNKIDIPRIPRISTNETVVLCAHILSCIQSINLSTKFPIEEEDTNHFMRTIPYLTELRNVVIGCCLEDIQLLLISQHCLKLESIIISPCSRATSTILLQLAENCRYLHTIELFDEYLCNDEVVVGLATHCPNLQKLHFYYIGNISDTSLLALSKHCLQLRDISLRSRISLTEDIILKLIYNSKYLRRLKLSLDCMSEDTVLSLPVTVEKENYAIILNFNV